MKLKTFFLNLFIITLSLSGVVAILMFLFSDFNKTVRDLLFTMLFLAIYSVFALSSGILYDRNKHISIFYLGIMASLTGFLYTTAVIWEIIQINNDLKFGLILFILAASVAHISLLLQMQAEKTVTEILRSLTIICIGVVAILLIYFLIQEADVKEFYYRLLGIFVVLDVLGTIIFSISNRINW